jgi:uncharacterized protein
MSQENVETIRGLFRGVEERDLEAYLAVGHPEVVIREPDSLPYGGEYRGLDGLRRHAAGWMRTWAALQPGKEGSWMRPSSTRATTWSHVGG